MNFICLDNIIFSLQKSGGISVVWSELLKRLLLNDKFELYFLEFASSENLFRSLLNLSTNNRKVYSTFSLKYRRYLPVTIYRKTPFIFHSSYFRISSNPHAINITTVHDFTYEYFYHGLRKRIHCWQKYYAIKKSKYVICISENTKKDLLKFMPNVDERKIRVIYNGVSDDYYRISSDDFVDSIPYSAQSYLLFVGERKAYKNFEFIVKCFKNIDYNLVIVGSKLTELEIELLESHIPSGHYCYVGRVSNQRLNVLYNYAAALLYPSSYEGFGIPVIEAQKAGCPVIAFNSSSITEIIGDTPLLMNHLTSEEFISKINMLSDHSLIKKVIIDGLKNSNRFSWDNMYEQLMLLYAEALL